MSFILHQHKVREGQKSDMWPLDGLRVVSSSDYKPLKQVWTPGTVGLPDLFCSFSNLFIFREEGREGERKGQNIDVREKLRLIAYTPRLGTKTSSQA